MLTNLFWKVVKKSKRFPPKGSTPKQIEIFNIKHVDFKSKNNGVYF